MEAGYKELCSFTLLSLGDESTLCGVCLVQMVMYRSYDIFEVFREATDLRLNVGDHCKCNMSYCWCMDMWVVYNLGFFFMKS